MSGESAGHMLCDDLMSASRDAAYRAMSFVARAGGPRIAGSPDDRTNLMAQRAGMHAWLAAQPDRARLESDYLQFRKEWSPIFKD